jgi:hypothetical protein
MASGRLSKVKGKVLDIPTPPTIGTATAGGESVSIAFTASSKGGPTRSYIAKSNPGNITATGSTSPISVTGLTVGTSYTISVAGVNEFGTGEYSSASGSAVPVVATSYESIATVNVGSGGVSTIDFTSIPSTYKSLQLRMYCKTARTTYTISELKVTFNGDTANNYANHYLTNTANTSTVYSSASSSQPRFQLVGFGTSINNQFGTAVMDIIDYASTSKYKVARAINGVITDVAGAGSYYGHVGIISGLWQSTSAITSISLTCEDPVNIAQYSSFALYGMK